MPSQGVTLKQVARQAGVSVTTASYVLTGRGQDMRISEQARDRVLRAASELRYRPNLMARSLSTKVTRTIALVSDRIATGPHAGEMVRGALAAALEHEHLLLIGETEGDPAVEARLVDDFLGHQVDGFVYATRYTRTARVPRALLGQPFVLLNGAAQDPGVPAVLPDQRAAGRAVAQAVLDAGHRDGIHVVGAPPPERRQGIEDAMAAVGALLARVVDCSWRPGAAFAAVTALLRAPPRPTALLCMSDEVAFGAYQALGAGGLTIPGDVSVAAFDDGDSLASWLRPPLAGVALPHRELGRRAVERLLEPHLGTGVELVAMPLHRRASIGPPAHAS